MNKFRVLSFALLSAALIKIFAMGCTYPEAACFLVFSAFCFGQEFLQDKKEIDQIKQLLEKNVKDTGDIKTFIASVKLNNQFKR